MRNKTRIPLLPFLLSIEVLATAIKEEKEMCFVCVCVCVCVCTHMYTQSSLTPRNKFNQEGERPVL